MPGRLRCCTCEFDSSLRCCAFNASFSYSNLLLHILLFQISPHPHFPSVFGLRVPIPLPLACDHALPLSRRVTFVATLHVEPFETNRIFTVSTDSIGPNPFFTALNVGAFKLLSDRRPLVFTSPSNGHHLGHADCTFRYCTRSVLGAFIPPIG